MSLACLSASLFFSASAYAANVSYDTKYNGHCYKIFNTGMTWAQAKTACEKQGGHLVTITSAQEQAVVENLLRSKGNKNSYWLGGYRNGNTWAWVTGERFSYTRWSGGQPDNFQGRENRLSMYRNRNPYASNNLGEWNDAAEDGVCNNEPFFGATNFGYICEWDSDPNLNVDGRLKGDVNGDGKVDVDDCVTLLNYVNRRIRSVPCPKNADANGDGQLTMADVEEIKRIAIGGPTYKTLSNGWYKIHPSHARNLSLDAEGAVTGNGNNVHMWANLDVSQQKFYLENRGNGYFSLKAGHKQTLYVTAEGSGNGANLATRPWSNSASQLFRLVDGGSGTYHIMAKVNESLNFDCAGAGRTAATNAQLWTKETGSAHHKWIFESTSAPVPPQENKTGWIRTNGARLNMRSGPSTSSGIIAKLENGMQVTVLETRSDGWSRVNTPSGEGYVSSQYITFEKQTPVNNNIITQPMKNMYCTWQSKSTWSWGTRNTGKAAPRQYHLGCDVYGTNGYVYATASGTVAACSNSNSGANGRYIVIKHNIGGQTCYSFYAHLASIKVSNGQNVSVGDHIAVAGGSANGKDNYYGTHLHFAFVDTLKQGTYYGYATSFSGDKVNYNGVTFYNPMYVLNYGKLP